MNHIADERREKSTYIHTHAYDINDRERKTKRTNMLSVICIKTDVFFLYLINERKENDNENHLTFVLIDQVYKQDEIVCGKYFFPMGNFITSEAVGTAMGDERKAFDIVWLDANVNSTAENRQAQEHLRTMANRLKLFENSHECEKYIRSKSSKRRLLLIVNDPQDRDVIAHVHSLPQVISIYVHGQEPWALEFEKV